MTTDEGDDPQIAPRLTLVCMGYVYSLAALVPNTSAIYLVLHKFQMTHIWGVSMLMACTVAILTIKGIELRGGESGLALLFGAGPSRAADDLFPAGGGIGWYISLTVVALWGGLLAHARRYDGGARPASVIWTLVVDIGGAGLVTIGVYAIAIWAGASQLLSVGLAGILGHNGVRLLSVFEDEITQTVRSFFSAVRNRLPK